MALVSLQEISLAFGGPQIFDKLTLQIEEGEKIALLGRNGEGKTTLMKVIAKEQNVDFGNVIHKKGIKIALLSQEIQNNMKGTVYEVVLSGLLDRSKLLNNYNNLVHDLHKSSSKELMNQMDKLQNELNNSSSWNVKHEVEYIISQMNLNPENYFEQLSGGYKRRVLLCKTLVLKPDVLLLDEPTNHLDIESIKWLENFLKDYKKTVLFATHDRAFMEKLSTRIIELDRGKIYSFACNYNTFIERKSQAIDIENIRLDKLEKKLSEEEIWIRKGVKARRCRNEGRVKALERLREEKKKQRNAIGQVKMPNHNYLLPGHLVIKASHIKHNFENNTIIRDFSTQIMRGDKIGIIGSNGSGKTTLINILLQKLVPCSGKVCLGSNLNIAYFDQFRESLNIEKTVAENVSDICDTIMINGKAKHIISYLEDFLFTPNRSKTPVKFISGGERNRLLLARLFAKPFNLLVMDEPTNDLDIDTLELLEEILLEYKGTLILVSHDRTFINNVVTTTMVINGKGEITEYSGGYNDWLNYTANFDNKDVSSQNIKQNKPKKTETSLIRKLSFKEKRELEEMPLRIENLENEREKIYILLSESSFYQKSADIIIETKLKLKTLDDKIKESYDRWEYLSSVQ